MNVWGLVANVVLHKNVALLACAAAVCAGLQSFGASAEESISPASRPQAAYFNKTTLPFDIPAGDLAIALDRWSERSKLKFVASTEMIRGLRTLGVSGAFTSEAALVELLKNSGLQFNLTGKRTVAIFAPGAPRAAYAQASTLETILVEGTRVQSDDNAGIIARRSTTGSKTSTPLIETPRAISVISREQMDVQRSSNVQEALRYTPGVFAESSGVQPLSDNFYIRGFFQGSANPNIFQDGMLRLSAPIETYGLERIEVLRGPASVLYGQNSPGGLVNLVSKRPPDRPLHELQLQAGSFERKQAAFDFGGPINQEGSLAYRLTGLVRDSDAQVDFSKNNRAFVSGSLLWRPTAQTAVTLLADYQKDDVTFFVGYPAAGTVLPNPNGRIPVSRFLGEPGVDKNVLERTTVGYLAEHQFDNDWTVRQNLRYGHLDTELNQVTNLGLQANQRFINRGLSLRPQSTDLLTLDSQVQRKFETGAIRHTVLAGLDYRRSWQDALARTGTVSPLDLYAPVYGKPVTIGNITTNTYQDSAQTGLYLQDQMKIAERLVITVAGRQDWSRIETTNRLTNRVTVQDDRASTGQIGAVYLTDFGVAPYVSYATSFLPVTGTAFGGNPFKPEKGEQYEAGLKFEPKFADLTATISVFDLTRQNVTTPDTVNIGFNTQTGEVRARGLEANVIVRPVHGLNVLAGYTYTDAEVTKSNAADLGRRPFRVPTHLAALWADYTIQGGPLAGVGFGGGVRFVGESAGDLANTFFVPAYTLFDAMLRYEIGSYRFAINATNILDKPYVAACFAAGNGCNYGQARTVLATMTYRW